MQTVTSFDASAVPEAEVSSIIAEHLALERMRIVRRLLMVRCGLLAAVTAVAGLGLRWLTPFTTWVSMSAFLAFPAAIWIVERRRDGRLGQRLANVPGSVTQVVSPEPPRETTRR